MARKNDSPLFEDVFEKTQPAAAEEPKPADPEETQPAAPEIEKDPESVRATFMIDSELLDRFKDYCYTRRITQSAGLTEAITNLLIGVKDEDILKRPKK